MSLATKRTLDNTDITGKRVFIRVDFNVPLDKADPTKITDDGRIRAALPTIREALNKASSVVICSHLGRPQGQVVQKYTLEPVAKRLSELLDVEVPLIKSPLETYKNTNLPDSAKPICLLENVRFYVAEEGKGIDSEGNSIKATEEQCNELSEFYSSLGDIFINDAFGTSHRGDLSMVGKGFELRISGRLVQAELLAFSKVLEGTLKPLVAIVGGAKVLDKIAILENLVTKVDKVVIGGGMAYTFLKELKGMEIGKSIYSESSIEALRKFMEKAAKLNVQIIFPCDFQISDKFSEDGDNRIVTVEEGIPSDYEGLDCGPKTIKLITEELQGAKAVLWNGPLGVFEIPKFAQGTHEVIRVVAELTKSGVETIIGGGDTASCVRSLNLENDFTHVSTGGGAALELLEGKVLPGIAVLNDMN